jgi:hypothetical protein
MNKKNQISIELTLADEGYARLANITNALAKDDSTVDLGAVVRAAIELGTAVMEQQLKNKAKRLQLPIWLSGAAKRLKDLN